MVSNYLCSTKHQSNEKPEFFRVFQYEDILMVRGICPLLIISKPPAGFKEKKKQNKPRVASKRTFQSL